MSGTPEGLCTACSATQYCAEHDPNAAAAPAPEGLVERALGFVAEFQGDDRCFLNRIHAEALAGEVHRLRARPALSDEVLSGMARHRCREYAEKFTQQDLVEFARAVLARQQGTR